MNNKKGSFFTSQDDFVLFVGNFNFNTIDKYINKMFKSKKNFNITDFYDQSQYYISKKNIAYLLTFHDDNSIQTKNTFIYTYYTYENLNNIYRKQYKGLFTFKENNLDYLFEKLYLNFGMDSPIFMDLASKLSFYLILHDNKTDDFYITNGCKSKNHQLYWNIINKEQCIVSNNPDLLQTLRYNIDYFPNNCYIKNGKIYFWTKQMMTSDNELMPANNSYNLFFHLIKERIDSCLKNYKLECQIDGYDLTGLISDIMSISKTSQSYLIEQEDNLFIAYQIIENAFKTCVDKQKHFIDVGDFVTSIIQCEYLNSELRTNNGIEIFDKWYNYKNKEKVKIKTK